MREKSQRIWVASYYSNDLSRFQVVLRVLNELLSCSTALMFIQSNIRQDSFFPIKTHPGHRGRRAYVRKLHYDVLISYCREVRFCFVRCEWNKCRVFSLDQASTRVWSKTQFWESEREREREKKKHFISTSAKTFCQWFRRWHFKLRNRPLTNSRESFSEFFIQSPRDMEQVSVDECLSNPSENDYINETKQMLELVLWSLANG